MVFSYDLYLQSTYADLRYSLGIFRDCGLPTNGWSLLTVAYGLPYQSGAMILIGVFFFPYSGNIKRPRKPVEGRRDVLSSEVNNPQVYPENAVCGFSALFRAMKPMRG